MEGYIYAEYLFIHAITAIIDAKDRFFYTKDSFFEKG
jgi:hypothetical protein